MNVKTVHSSSVNRSRIIVYPFTESFIHNLADYVEENFIRAQQDLRRVAVVFGGKRPALFLKRELARRQKTAFYSPRFFTINEFMGFIVRKKEPFAAAAQMDNNYLLYQLAQKAAPQVLAGRETFAAFLPWAREILEFIDMLDLEDVANDKLVNIQANAQIGYDVPEDINRLLKSIVALREAYHQEMLRQKKYSRGLQYWRAARLVAQVDLAEFDQVLFCNFFYLNSCESAVLKDLHSRGKATLIFQGDERKWPILQRTARHFGATLTEGEQLSAPSFQLRLYSGFDMHSQVAVVREILKGIRDLDKTVIVLPTPDNIVPLLSEITRVAADFNISMGYPLKRSSLYSLFEFVFSVQMSRKGDAYYARDYLKVLRHPFVKNLKLSTDMAVTRILIHKIEEILTGKEKAAISGSLFFELEDMLSGDELYLLSQELLDRMGMTATRQQLWALLEEIHELFFERWEQVSTFAGFAEVLEKFLDVLVKQSFLRNYPLNINIAAKMLMISDEFKNASFRNEYFPPAEIFKIFTAKVEGEIMAFHGSPLKGLQILGLFETRSLNFDNVIVLDVNERTMPRLSLYQPLIPREVMVSLNLDRLEQEEEIQRYQFMRLISSAKNVHLVYQESRDKERSRFIEELIWEEQKKQPASVGVPVISAGFEVRVTAAPKSVPKTRAIIEHLRKMKYSASSINAYLRNPLEFYYRYVLGLQEQEDLLDEPESRQVGTFVHDLLEQSFRPFLKKRPLIDAVFRARFERIFEQRFAETFGRSMKSDSFLLKSVLTDRLKRFLDNEEFNEERQVEEIMFLENRFEDTVFLPCGEFGFKYIVDRVDKLKDGTVMIVDYKTGSTDLMPKSVEGITRMELSREAVRDNVRSFQVPLYFHYLDKQFKGHKVNAALYNLRTLAVHKFIDPKSRFSADEINAAFLRALDFVLREILDPAVPFIEEKSSES